MPREGSRVVKGGCTELEVSESASSSLEQHHLLSVVSDVADILAGLGVVDNGAAGHVDVYVLAVLSVTLVASAVASVFCEDVALEFQVEQCPVVMVASEDDASSVSAVATVRSAVRIILDVSEVH